MRVLLARSVILMKKSDTDKIIMRLSPLWIVIAGCLWGSMGIFVRRYNSYGVEAMSIVFLRALFTAVITLGGIAVFDRSKLKFKIKDIWIFAGIGLASIVFFNYCYFTSISLTSLSTAAILLYTSPIFVMLMSAVLFKEKITPKKICAMLVSIAGLVLVTGVLNGSASVTPRGVMYGIGSAIGYALYSIFSRAAINRGYSALTLTGWGFAFAAIFSALFADMRAVGTMFSAAPQMIMYTVLFALVVSVLPYIMYSTGLRGTENDKAAVIASVEPVAATVIGLLLYGEIPSVSAVIGIALVIAALAMSIERAKE